MRKQAFLIKKFTICSHKLRVRTDFFNFLNRTTYGIPVRILESQGFGKAVNTAPHGRQKFSLKYEFSPPSCVCGNWSSDGDMPGTRANKLEISFAGSVFMQSRRENVV
ncbi:MAG TPA: hypothetical protein PLP21_04965 [Pyrinomonadaceae bacterium]|nr:hypothetical protein [Acidobacteriota bacterium]HQZ95645.1 hypothetical protein [Pyrinomonadaceae bacterium]